MSTSILLTGARICLPTEIVDGASLVIDDGLITSMGEVPTLFDGQRFDLQGALICPGFIDGHIHGGLEHDIMDGTRQALAGVAAHLATHGVTGWLPTTFACPAEQLERVLKAVGEAMADQPSGARVLGAHLESNFLSPKYKGAQPESELRPADDPELLGIIERHRAAIRVITLAPELPGALDLIRQLRAWDILVAVGHSDATYAQVLAAVEAGATRITHLCNAQRPFHHREPGVVGAALVVDRLAVEMIADLEHVHPAGMVMAYRCKGPSKLMLVSDALRGAGLAPGNYELGGRTTTLDGRVARLADGTIAGSIITLERAIANMVNACAVPWFDAVAMASTAPAASLELADCGSIAAGKRADLAVLDRDGSCLATMIGGRWAFGADFQGPIGSPS